MTIYCSRCSKKINKKSTSLYVCSHCGFHLYLNPKPTNALILENKKGQILLVKRRDPPKKNFWDLPGGFVTINETMEEAIRREIKEELGIQPEKIKYLFSFSDRYLYKGDNYYILGFFFSAKTSQEKFKVRDDITEAQFFEKSKIPFEKIAFENIKRGLKLYLSSSK